MTESGGGSFWEQLKQRRVVRVALLYAAVGWAVIEGADTISPMLALPGWAPRLVLALVFLGFPVALVLAWAFQVTAEGVKRSAPAVTAGGHPSRLPFLAGLAAGIASVSAAAWLVSDGDPALPGVTDAGDLDSGVVAIVPFRYSGPDDLAYFGEGIVDLLAARFTGDVGPRAVDPAAAGAVWQELAAADPAGAGEGVARRLGAGLVVSGSIVADPGGLNVRATLRDLEGGADVGSAELYGPADSIAGLVDRLGASLLSLSAGDYAESLDQLTSTSTEALREYLLGQQAYRAGQFDAATRLLRGAVALDSTFALAAIAAADAAENSIVAGSSDMLELAWRHQGRLSERDRLYLRARLGPNYPDPSTLVEAIQAFQEALAVAPDRAQMWYFLGERHFHYRRGLTDDWSETAEAYFREALRLDPGHAAAALHVVLVHMDRSDLEGIRAGWETMAALDTTEAATSNPALGLALMSRDMADLQPLHEQALRSEAPYTRAWATGLLNNQIFADTLVLRLALEGAEAAERLPLTGREEVSTHLALYRFYQLVGRPRRAHQTLARWEERNNRVLARRRVLSAAFDALGDDLGTAAAAVLERQVESFDPEAAGAGQFPDLVALELYRVRRGDLERTTETIRVLREAASRLPPASGMAFESVALLLEAITLQEAGDMVGAANTLDRMDAVYVQGPGYGDPWLRNAMLFPMARLHEQLGDPARALATLDREARHFNAGDDYGATYARERGRLAALVGDTARARREYGYYLTLRSLDPEPEVQAEIEEVRRAYDALGG